MLNSLPALLAFFLSNLGPPDLPVPGQGGITPGGPQASVTCPAPEVSQEFTVLEDIGVIIVSPSQINGTDLRQGTRLNLKLKASIEKLINKYAKRHGVDETLIRAVLRQESGGNPRAVSPKGAMGLMQLMPDTAVLLGVKDPFDPEENLAGGVKYLKHCLDSFHQDQALALAAYNAGPEAVKKYGGVPPYRETQQYVASILGDGAGSNVTRGATTVVKRTPSKELKPESHQEEGLEWRLPRPTWKIPETVVKVPGPKWKVCPAAVKLTLLRPKKTITAAGKVSLIDSPTK
jgi:hypothetical protein